MDDQTVDDSTGSDTSAATNASTTDNAPSTTLTDEHHDWVSNFCGIDTRAEAETGGDSSTGANASGNGSDGSSRSGGLLGALPSAAGAVSDAASEALSTAESAVSDASSAISQVDSREETAPAQPPASADDHESDGGSPSGVLDSLGSMASGVGSALSGAASTASDAANTAGKAVMSAETAAWDGTKSAFDTITGAYDSVAPNFTETNHELGKLIDKGEAEAKNANEKAAAESADGPVFGSLEKASAWLGTATIDAAGGLVKGVGDLATMAGNAIVHPIDAAASMAEGALGAAEHVPFVPGLNTEVKAVHGLVDLAEGKKDGEYGGSLTDLGKNLLLDTKQDPNDPSKQTNADIDFVAGFGGGTKAWIANPVDAAARTFTNIAGPMLLGDAAAGEPGEAPPKDTPRARGGGEPKGGGGGEPPNGGDPPNGGGDPPAPDTQPYSNTLDLGKTQPDLGETQPNASARGPQAEVDPANPQPEPDAPKASPEQEALLQARQNLIDASAAYKVAEQASSDALGEWVRYRATKPNPGRGVEGDPSWSPAEAERLRDQYLRLRSATDEAGDILKAAQQAMKAAQQAAIDVARRAKGAGGG